VKAVKTIARMFAAWECSEIRVAARPCRWSSPRNAPPACMVRKIELIAAIESNDSAIP